MKSRSSRTGVPGFHAQRHTRTTQRLGPRVYYQFWGQLTHHGSTLKTPRFSNMDLAFAAYQLLRASHGYPPRPETPTHPWILPGAPSSGGDSRE